MKVTPITPQEYNNNINTKSNTSFAQTGPIALTESSLNKTDQDVYVRRSSELDASYERHLLPSRGFFYSNKKDIIFRPFRVGDLKKLQHYLQTDNISHLIDAIQNCIEPSIDVRELTFDDFLYVVFRIVFASHPDPKYTFVWNSFYGNEGEVTINPSDLDVSELKYAELMTQIPNFRTLGLVPLLVKSYEMLHNNQYKEEDTSTWDQEKSWLYKEVACFLDAPSPEAQLKKAEELEVSSEIYQKLSLFKQLSKHSIKTELKTTDRKFLPEAAIKTLTERAETLKTIKMAEPDTYQEMAKEEVFNLAIIQEEIDRIQTGLTQSQEVRAKEETIPFRFNLTSLIRPLFA